MVHVMSQRTVEFPSQRGTAVRSSSKTDRVGTHKPVVELCLSMIREATVIEHGMGVVSTPFFHKHDHVRKIISFEDDPSWKRCQTCKNQERLTQEHTIVDFSLENLRKATGDIDPQTTLVLVDGPHTQRIQVIKFLLELSVFAIVEHDAESLPIDEFNERVKIASESVYSIYQYVDLNPETLLYTRQNVSNMSFVRISQQHE